MFFRQLATREATLSYLFGCGSCGVAVAVDPVAGDEEWFIAESVKQNVKITHVIDTHVHADHYSGGRALAERVGGLYCLHESNATRVKFPFHSLKDQDVIEVGNVAVTVLHTPGHTPDSICLLVSDKRRSLEPWFVLTGDTLFVGSIGRPDLGSQGQAWAGQLFNSLHQRLLALPDSVEVFPGHTSGSVCGAGISGKPSSTVGFERRFNAGLQFGDSAEFVAHILADIPPRPAEMERMVAANLGA
ncbi:MAG: MBL fold metallo-hydrolase [Sulfuricella sp.]|nr:MBL fold metallo-hydrolase [Sulfuricella sp.]